MSKSLGNHIPLTVFSQGDKPLRKLLGRAVTDEKRVTREDPGNPDDCNVGTMHKAISSAEDLAWVYQGCTTAGIGCVDCKGKLADNLTAHFAAYVARRAELIAAPERVQAILEQGAAKARSLAQRTMADVHKKLGLWRSR
jgi:tryptophanyl-tRNA synthetase